MCRQYCQVLIALINKHAPIQSKSASQKPSAQWMISEILKSKKRRRYLEGERRKSRSSLDRSRYIKQGYLCNRQRGKPNPFINRTCYQIFLIVHVSCGTVLIIFYTGGKPYLYPITYQLIICVTPSLIISIIHSVFRCHTPRTVDSLQLSGFSTYIV